MLIMLFSFFFFMSEKQSYTFSTADAYVEEAVVSFLKTADDTYASAAWESFKTPISLSLLSWHFI